MSEGYGNYLKVDMRVECPKDTQDAGFAWSTVFVFIFPIGIPMFFAFILWYFQVPKLANRKRDYYLFKEIVIGMHTDLPEAQKVLLFLEDWKWEHDPVCLLRRNQCLAILLHPWRDLEITEETGGFNFLAGKGMDVATQGLQNATTDLSDAVTAAENAVMKTEDENAVNANEQEGHSSTSPSSRIPAPDLKKNLPNTQPQPCQPQV